MSCEHLVCAGCAGPVSEGRCPRCRQARAEVHHHALLPAPLLLAALLAALVVVLVLTQLRTG